MAHLANIRQSGDGALKGVPFFHDLTSGEIEAFNRMVVKKHYSREEVVLFEEDTAKYMYIILSGKVRVVQIGTEGKERILAIHKRGDYFGELALFDGKTSPATVIAMEESYIGLLSKNDFDGLVFKNDKILLQFIATLCTRLRESWMMLKIMSFANAEERVRLVLKYLIILYGVKEQRGVLIALKLTHKDIANYAAVSRETVTRLLNRFTNEGEIEILDKRYLLIKPAFMKNPHKL
jgi:CRP/FNR family cyclic AMP-dependent transcriptional regulator